MDVQQAFYSVMCEHQLLVSHALFAQPRLYARRHGKAGSDDAPKSTADEPNQSEPAEGGEEDTHGEVAQTAQQEQKS